MEKLVLRIKLERRLTGEVTDRVRLMDMLKRLVAFFLECRVDDFHVSAYDWEEYGHKITHKKDKSAKEFALMPMEYGEVGLRKRFCFARRGNVYLTISCMIDVVTALYGNYLKGKLERMRGPVTELLATDSENQLSAFIRKTLETLNTTNFDDTTLQNSQFRLTIKNI